MPTHPATTSRSLQISVRLPVATHAALARAAHAWGTGRSAALVRALNAGLRALDGGTPLAPVDPCPPRRRRLRRLAAVVVAGDGRSLRRALVDPAPSGSATVPPHYADASGPVVAEWPDGLPVRGPRDVARVAGVSLRPAGDADLAALAGTTADWRAS